MAGNRWEMDRTIDRKIDGKSIGKSMGNRQKRDRLAMMGWQATSLDYTMMMSKRFRFKWTCFEEVDFLMLSDHVRWWCEQVNGEVE
jgi:hypothetical protein